MNLQLRFRRANWWHVGGIGNRSADRRITCAWCRDCRFDMVDQQTQHLLNESSNKHIDPILHALVLHGRHRRSRAVPPASCWTRQRWRVSAMLSLRWVGLRQSDPANVCVEVANPKALRIASRFAQVPTDCCWTSGGVKTLKQVKQAGSNRRYDMSMAASLLSVVLHLIENRFWVIISGSLSYD